MSYGTDLLYQGVGFGVAAGEKIAFVGPNGCGKSTLFQILAGQIVPDEGEVIIRGDTTLGYLAQEEKFGAHDTPRDVVARALLPVRRAIEEHTELSEKLSHVDGSEENLDQMLERQAFLQERIQKSGGWSWEHRVEEMLDRLGVTTWIDEPARNLSGGQRRRVDLARVLLESPDLLLLDEPTNHLDTTAVEWLEDWLIDHVHTLIFVTHDRYFLERIADRILEIDDDFYDYPGNFQTFMERKTHRDQVRERTEVRNKKLLEKELQWLQGSVKSQNKRSKQRLDRIDDLRQETSDWQRRVIEMPLGEPGDFSDTILSARGIWKSFDGDNLLESANLDLRPGNRLGIIGPNGCGKSTLLKILAGQERIDAGTVEEGKLTDIAFLGQDHLDVDPDTTAIEAVSQNHYVWIGDRKIHRRDYLALYLLDSRLQKMPVRILSGGQKRRLAIARAFAKNPNVLLLDEPTNDLDILSLQALEESLRTFEGCVIAISHDRYFLNRVCTAIVAFEDKKLVRYEGDYDAYRKRREATDSQKMSPTQPPPATSSPTSPSPPPPTKPGRSTPRAGLSYREKQRLEALETRIAQVEEEQQEVEDQLADPSLYQSRVDDVEPLNRRLRALQTELDELWEKWAELEERKERSS